MIKGAWSDSKFYIILLHCYYTQKVFHKNLSFFLPASSAVIPILNVVVKTATTKTNILSRLNSIETKTKLRLYVCNDNQEKKMISKFKFSSKSNSNNSFQQGLSMIVLFQTICCFANYFVPLKKLLCLKQLKKNNNNQE